MSQMKRVVDAGPLHMEFLYPRASPSDSETARHEKKKLTGEAQARLNKTCAVRRLACLMAENFSPGDHALVLTFDDAHLPPSRGEALRMFDNFCRGLKRARARRGKTLLVLASEEHRHGDGRWHIHALVNNAGDLDELRRRWKYGLTLEAPFRQGKTKNALTLACYYTKERKDKVGQNRWLRRGALRSPRPERWSVPDSAALRLPPGAVLLERTDRVNTFGKTQFLFYMDGEGAGKRRRRPRGREKRDGSGAV